MIDRENRATEERSRRILETAIELAEKGGFSAVRLRDVAEQAGVALGTVYKRFQSKEDMLMAALEMQMNQLESHVIAEYFEGDTSTERIVSLIELLTAWLCGKPKLARAVLRAMAAGEPALSGKIASFRNRIDAFIVGALRNEDPGPLIENSGLISVTELQLAHFVQGAWFAALVGWSAELHSDDAVVEQVREITDLLLLGQEAQAKECKR